jgi:hypothetical protein
VNHPSQDVQRIESEHDPWHVWFVPRATDGHLTWCAQRWTGGDVIHAGSPGELEALIMLAQSADRPPQGP